MQLGSGFTAALEQATKGASNDLAGVFERALNQIGGDIQKQLDRDLAQLRKDLIAEVRAEVARVEGSEVTDKLCAALARVGTPIVNVSPPQVTVQAPNVEVLPADVTVNVPAPPAPQVTVDRPKKQKVLRDGDGNITGIEAVK